MKKFALLGAIALLSVSLFACQKPTKITINALATNEEYSSATDYSKKSYSDYTYQIDVDGLNDLINMKTTFAFLFEGSTCSSCLAMKPAFIQYVLTYKTAFYSLDTDSFSNYEDLSTQLLQVKDTTDKNVFDEYDGTPTFFFFEQGVLKEKLPKTKSMSAFHNLKAILNARIKVNKQKLVLHQKIEDLSSAKTILFLSKTPVTPTLLTHVASLEKTTYLVPLYLNDLSESFYEEHQLEKKDNATILRSYQAELYSQMEITATTTIAEIDYFIP